MHIAFIKGTNMDLTDAIKSYVEEKLGSVEKLCEAFGTAAEVRVEVGKTTNHHNKGPIMKAEFTLHLPGTVLRAEETREDLYESIDTALADLRRQVKNYKDKLKERDIAPRPGKE